MKVSLISAIILTLHSLSNALNWVGAPTNFEVAKVWFEPSNGTTDGYIKFTVKDAPNVTFDYAYDPSSLLQRDQANKFLSLLLTAKSTANKIQISNSSGNLVSGHIDALVLVD